jgi:Ca-activated chloride channel family protein
MLEPPEDLAAWATQAAATEVAAPGAGLKPRIAVLFPRRQQQRLIARILLTLPADSALGTVVDDGKRERRVAVEAVLEQEGKVFDEFRVRFKLPPSDGALPTALAIERPLRPGRAYLARLRVTDEVDGASARLARGFLVPTTPQSVAEPAVPEGVIVALGEELAERRLAGRDGLLLVPPEDAVVVGVWRAETLVSGERIVRVVFSIDGEEQLVKTRPPFTAELRLARFPTEQVVRAEGYDDAGELVAADEVVLNQPRGAFRVRILEPARGAEVGARVRARAEVVVPDERRVEKVEFFVNEELQATRGQVPWEEELELSDGGDVSYLTVVATLDDGSRSEAVRFLNAPRFLEEVEVDLVEVLATVVDRSGRAVAGLGRDEFRVLEDGREQKIERFELVEDLPLAVGFAIDTSGSMEMALPEAQKAAIGFLENLITPQDTVFAVGFADEPVLLIPPTDDVRAVEEALQNLQSLGWTALHDAVVTSLYYFRAVRGRRALILLSDGDDSTSYYPFREALEYARRSGVVIYTVGIGVSAFKQTIRRKLDSLAEETGGRAFFIDQAEELTGVYRSIEEELRSQYLITYSSDGDPQSQAFRTIDVELRSRGLKARAARGYYPN